ncbi:hypothetical protein [Erythrobacter sp. HKB08]|uniref:hypothetical protein n=1 Tax=Erythrobacter sp. HKB08 TaxID=2502843 RepID=UPI001008A3ED|nr:hypothetical protein [Erythrobacter sp. HKB08]
MSEQVANCSPDISAEICSAEAAWAAVDIASSAATSSFWLGLLGMAVAGVAAFFAFRAYMTASEANEIAVESTQRLNRAYLDFNGVKFVCKPQMPDQPVQCQLRIELKNFGNTPADQLALNIDFELTESATKQRIKGASEKLSGLGAIMPHDEWGRNTSFTVSQGEYLALQTGGTQVNATIEAEYKDSFGADHAIKSSFVGDGTSETLGYVANTRSNT